MFQKSGFVTKLIRVRNLKIALILQSIVTITGVMYIMFNASCLDQAGPTWKISFTDARCRGCCVMPNSSIQSIGAESQISEKLHKFYRAIRQYGIPSEILNILHEAEHKIVILERDLKQYNELKESHKTILRDKFIEDDVLNDQELVPKAKPKWKKQQKKS